MTRRLIAALVLVLAGALPVAAAEPAPSGTPYEIPVVLPLTGPAAFLGQGEQLTLQFVEKTVNDGGGIKGRPLRFVIKDDQSNPQIAVQLATEIIATKPAVLLGSSLVASCRAMSPLVQDGGPVHYCFSPGIHPDKGSYTFTSSVSTIDLIKAQIRYFRLKGWKRFAFMVSTDATGQDAENAIRDTLAEPENKDMHLVAVAHFNPSDLSVAAQIETVKAAKPQSFIAWSTGAPIATIFRAAAAAGLDVPFATTSGNMTYQQMAQYKDFLPKQLYFAAAQWVVRDPAQLRPGVEEGHAALYNSYASVGKKPDISSELAWDPAMIVVAALRALGPDATAPQIHEWIEHLKGYAGIDGVFDFEKVPQRGLDVTDAVITAWSPAQQTWQVVSKPDGAPL